MVGINVEQANLHCTVTGALTEMKVADRLVQATV